MSSYNATVIKTGNSYALRIPKQLANANNLHVGEKVVIGSIGKVRTQDDQKISNIIARLQGGNAYSAITNPVLWQKQQREDRY